MQSGFSIGKSGGHSTLRMPPFSAKHDTLHANSAVAGQGFSCRIGIIESAFGNRQDCGAAD